MAPASSPLNTRGAALCKRPYLLYRCHGRITRERGQERAVRPAQLDRFFHRLAGERAVDKSRCEPITAANTIEHVQFARRRDVRLAINPGYCAPGMPVRRMHLAQRRGDDLDLRMLLDYAIDHPEKRTGVDL